jgi:hypothetical protein
VLDHCPHLIKAAPLEPMMWHNKRNHTTFLNTGKRNARGELIRIGEYITKRKKALKHTDIMLGFRSSIPSSLP